jgi:hypothetical protein
MLIVMMFKRYHPGRVKAKAITEKAVNRWLWDSKVANELQVGVGRGAQSA